MDIKNNTKKIMESPIIDLDNNKVEVQGESVILTPVVPESSTVSKADYLVTQEKNLSDAQAEVSRLTDSKVVTQSQMDSIDSALLVENQKVSDLQDLITTLLQ